MEQFRRLGSWLGRQLLLEAPVAWKARRAILEDLESRDDAFDTHIDRLREVAIKMDDEWLQVLEANELERRRSIEGKAKTTVVGVTLSFAILSTSVGLVAALRDGNSAWVPAAVAVGLAVIGLYLLAAGWWSLEAMRVARTYQHGIGDGVEEEDQLEHRARRLYYVEQNQRVTNLRANALSVSFSGIRNAILSLAVALPLTLVALAASEPRTPGTDEGREPDERTQAQGPPVVPEPAVRGRDGAQEERPAVHEDG